MIPDSLSVSAYATNIAHVTFSVQTGGMTTFHSIGGAETLQDAVARRLRGLLAESRISKTELLTRTGWDRGYLYRRLSGETAINVNDLEIIERTTRIRAGYLITGTGPKTNNPPPPNGDGGSLLPWHDSNVQPSDCIPLKPLPAAWDRAPTRHAA